MGQIIYSVDVDSSKLLVKTEEETDEFVKEISIIINLSNGHKHELTSKDDKIIKSVIQNLLTHVDDNQRTQLNNYI
jgi:hypothetical protein